MWSQYGTNHEGICLVFSKKGIESLIDDNFKFENVKYVTKPFPLEDYNIEYGKLNHIGIDKYFDEFFNKKYKKIFFTKVNDYRDESEYRLLKRVKDTNIVYDYIDIKSCLKGVIIGDKCHQIYNHIFDYINKNDDLELMRCEFNQWTGTLTLEQYNVE